jgi:hypothetical protein
MIRRGPQVASVAPPLGKEKLPALLAALQIILSAAPILTDAAGKLQFSAGS